MAPDRYIRAIARLTENGEKSTTTSELAEELDVSDPSASEAVQDLEEDNLICRVPYKGFTLSPLGRERVEQESQKIRQLEQVLSRSGVEDVTEKAVKISEILDGEDVSKLHQNTS